MDGAFYKLVTTPADEDGMVTVMTEAGPERVQASLLERADPDEGVPAKLREKVLTRNVPRCQSCERAQGRLHAHHVQWRWHGGPSSQSNLVTLCSKCHWLVHLGLLEVRAARAGKQGRAFFMFRDRFGTPPGGWGPTCPILAVRVATATTEPEQVAYDATCTTDAPRTADVQWLAANLDGFETLGGRLTLKPSRSADHARPLGP